MKELCEAASAAGFKHLALTDSNGFYGLVNFLEAARRYGIQPIVGATVSMGNDSAVILAKTPRGYELLSELITRRHLDEDFSLIRSFPDSPGDLAVITASPEIIKALHPGKECWAEIVPGRSDREALRMAHDLGVPPLATNAVHFARPDDYPLHRLVRTIDLNLTLSTLPPGETVRPDRWLKPAAEMERLFPHCPEALANAVKLAGQCYTGWDYSRTVFPHYKDHPGDHFALLIRKCREGIQWRYGRSNQAVEERLQEELDLIRAKGFVDYFLVVADIVGRRPIHCGRGSGAASLVSYLLGITHVDPIRHHLLFGRFLNPERKDLPDIDVDFPWDERDDLFEELRRYYGNERLALVANHVGFGGRASVREVAKVYGIPAREIKEVTRRMNFWTDPEGLWDRVRSHPKFKDFPLDPPWPEIIDLAARLESLPRHLSTHCGGAVLVPDRISRYVPLQRNAKGGTIIQWEKDQTEKAGLVKIDLLGNRSLAVIRDALASIRVNYGKAMEYALLNPVDDPPTREIIRDGRTLGVFYVESPAMRLLQHKAGRGDFEHLVIHSSIIRPAANRYIREYLQRLQGAPYEPIHPSLRKLLSESYGILVYQEDVVQAAMILAGFTWGEADGLRKVISKKSREQLSNYRLRFANGCANRGVSPEVVNAVWEMFTSFSGYSFCKPHSASYALVSFKSAYLKVHYPAEFMAAVLSNGGGYYSTFAYVSEARRMGLTVLGPDIDESGWSYRGKDRTVRIGLQQIQNIKRSTLDAVIEEREKNGPFASIEDFLGRVDITPADAPALAKSGALDSLRGRFNRPQLLWFIEGWINRREARRNARQMQTSMFPRPGTVGIVPPLPDFSPGQRWQHERETLGFVLSTHPLAPIKPVVRGLRHGIIPASELAAHVGERVCLLGWPITRKEVLTKEEEPMEFVSFEDETDLYETVFFPGAFRRFCQDVDMNRAYLIRGRVESEFNTASLTVEHIAKLPFDAQTPGTGGNPPGFLRNSGFPEPSGQDDPGMDFTSAAGPTPR